VAVYRRQWCMPDVPVAVAVIGTITPVVAGALPLVIGWIKDGGHDKRERAERLEAERLRLAQEKRGECVKLLRLGRDFRVLMENAHESQGDDLTARLQEIRQAAASLTGQADEVGFMIPATEATADALAAEAGVLAVTVSKKRNRAGGAALMPPNFERFDQCLGEFKAAALVALNGQFALAAGQPDGVIDGQRPSLTSAAGHARGPVG
jgi:hypothetical protein